MWRNKYGIFKVISTWFDLLPQILDQWRVFIGYGMVFTVFSALLNRWTYACRGSLSGYWCYLPTQNGLLTFISAGVFYLLGMYLFISFIVDFYQGIAQKQKFHLSSIAEFSKQKFKNLAVVFIFLMLLILPSAVFVYIINKSANLDWRVEFLYFTIAFIMFMIALLTMRCSGGVAYYFNQGYVSIRRIYTQTSGRAYVGIFSFLILMLICADFNMTMIYYFNRLLTDYNSLWTALFSDFADIVLKLFYVSLFLILYQAQYLRLEENSASENAQNKEE